MNQLIDDTFELLERIGTGGFAEIYRGWDRLHDEEVAIKVLNARDEGNERFIKMFLDESEIAAKLNHPNLVKFLSRGVTQEGRHYYVTEFVDGYSLSEVLRRSRQKGIALSSSVVMLILKRVGLGLSYAHHLKDKRTGKPYRIVHRDVTPSNILISKQGHIKLADFGIAKADIERRDETQVLELKGKLLYMSPEQAKGGKNRVDHRSDIFSLGLVAYEMVTGAAPYRAGDDIELYNQVRKGNVDLARLEDVCDDKNLFEIIVRALNPEQVGRYQDAAEMAAEISQRIPEDKEDAVMQKLAGLLHELYTAQQVEITPDPAPRPITGDETELVDHTEGQTAVVTSPDGGAVRPQGHMTGTPAREEGEKTMIDVAFEFWRYQKKKIFAGLGMAAGFLLFLLVLDVFFIHASAPAKSIRAILYPPDLHITTIPPGAEVTIDGQTLVERTPVAIYGIGANKRHELVLRLEGYPDKRWDVMPMAAKSERNLKIPFDSYVRLESVPSGAQVFINGINYAERTPCPYLLTAGADYNFKYYLAGFDTLAGCRINILQSPEQQVDQFNTHYWEFTRDLQDSQTFMRLTGTLYRRLPLKVFPGDAQVYVDGALAGTADMLDVLLLKAGERTLRVSRANWQDLERVVEVSAETQPLQFALSRPVRFTVTGEDTSGYLNQAMVYIPNTRYAQGTTASEAFILPGYNVQAQVEYSGFKPRTVTITANAFAVDVHLERRAPELIVEVIDTATNRALANAGISIYQNNAFKGLSADRNGTARILEGIVPGTLTVTATFGTRNVTQDVTLRQGETKKIRLYL